jgi:hypothetical protein
MVPRWSIDVTNAQLKVVGQQSFRNEILLRRLMG